LAYTDEAAPLVLTGLRPNYTLRDTIRFVVTNASSTPQTFYCKGEIYLITMGGTWQEWEYRVEDNKRTDEAITHELRPGESHAFVWAPKMGWSTAPATLRVKLILPNSEAEVMYSPEFQLHRRKNLPKN
jgi:hypothetical protein